MSAEAVPADVTALDGRLQAALGYTFVDPTLPQETKLIGMHGSLTPDEMYVPLLGARGRA